MNTDIKLLAIATSEAIRELGTVPSGELYVHLMSRITLTEYESILSALIRAKLIERKHHLLTWIGPVLKGN